MLDWLTTAPSALHGDKDDHNNSTILEAPETPAPLFAVRAIKTALFGTPSQMKSAKKAVRQELTEESGDTVIIKHGLHDSRHTLLQSRPVKESSDKAGGFTSPAKGILLTPGTNKLQRKTVSFSASRSLRENALRGTMSADSGLNLGNRNQAKLSDSSLQSLAKKPSAGPNTTSVTEVQLISHNNLQVSERNKDDLLTASSKSNDSEKDVTMDLQEPQSRSGQHWKRQYSRYYIKSDYEMRKLLKYTQNAKSFATKRDAEAVELEEKLKTALAKVADMETNVSELASQLAQSGKSSTDVENQADLVTQVAAQTTEIFLYKQKIDELENIIKKGAVDSYSDHPESASVQHTQFMHSSESLELSSSRLFSQAQGAVARADSLEKENAALKETILRVKDEMKQYESRHKARRDEWRRSTDRAKARRTSLKDQLKQQQASHDHILGRLKAMHAKEIDDLRRQVWEIQAGRGRDFQTALSSQVGKGVMESRKAKNTEYEKEPQVDEFHGQRHLHHEHLRTLQGSKPLDGEVSCDGTNSIRKIKDSQADSRISSGQSIGLSESKDCSEQRQCLNEQTRGSGRVESFYDQVISDQENRISLPSPQKLEFLYQRSGKFSPQIADGSKFGTSSQKIIPPDRKTAAKLRLELKLAAKQQLDAAGKENVKTSRA